MRPRTVKFRFRSIHPSLWRRSRKGVEEQHSRRARLQFDDKPPSHLKTSHGCPRLTEDTSPAHFYFQETRCSLHEKLLDWSPQLPSLSWLRLRGLIPPAPVTIPPLVASRSVASRSVAPAPPRFRTFRRRSACTTPALARRPKRLFVFPRHAAVSNLKSPGVQESLVAASRLCAGPAVATRPMSS